MPKATASIAGTVIASADTYETVEGNIYFPPSSLDKTYFKETETTSHCPWKGEASYYSIEVGGQEFKDAAWYYPEPITERAEKIKGYVAFYKTKVDIKTE